MKAMEQFTRKKNERSNMLKSLNYIIYFLLFLLSFMFLFSMVFPVKAQTKTVLFFNTPEGTIQIYRKKTKENKYYGKTYLGRKKYVNRKRYVKKRKYVNRKRYVKRKKYIKRKRYTRRNYKKRYGVRTRIIRNPKVIKRVRSYRRSRMLRTPIVRWKGHRMPSSVALKLQEVQRKYGPIRIISSCRPGATVKKSGRPSMHRYCRAIDFNPPRGKYRTVANYLKRTWSGGVGTYSGRFNHIHIDDNRGRWHN